jgi:uncharacterized protein
MARKDSLSAAQARRIALAAQGFGAPSPGSGGATARHVKSVFGRLGLIQIDSVNVLARSHYLPLFSRIGAYDRALLDTSAWGKKPALFEYWAHEASLMPVEMQPLLRWRMARAAKGERVYGGVRKLAREQRRFIDAVHKHVETNGALAASELEMGKKGEGGWWGWSEGKRALEWLFWSGHLTTRTRRNSFERVYDLTERVLPAHVIAAPTPTETDAQRGLMEISARALGVATERDLRDYFRLKPAQSRAAVQALVEESVLLPVAVEGWDKPGYLHRDARIPRAAEAQALLSPFDNLIFFRDRAERLFNTRIKLEIYTPAARRTHGYYVLPFLLGDAIVARVDLKSDRKASALRVMAAHLEPGAAASVVAPRLAETLRAMGGWLDLERVEVMQRGDLAKHLASTLKPAKRAAK